MTPTQKLHELLSDKGFHIVLWKPALGYWRRQDVCRWEAWARHEGEDVYLYGYCPVKECAQKGIEIIKEDWRSFEVFALSQPKKEQDTNA